MKSTQRAVTLTVDGHPIAQATFATQAQQIAILHRGQLYRLQMVDLLRAAGDIE